MDIDNSGSNVGFTVALKDGKRIAAAGDDVRIFNLAFTRIAEDNRDGTIGLDHPIELEDVVVVIIIVVVVLFGGCA